MNVTDIWRVIEGYKLDSQTHDLVLEDIIEITCEGKSACDEPLAVVLGGQPAGGKSNLISWCMKNYFPDGNVCVVNGDEFRSMHPKSEEIHRLHEELYAEITDADVRTWTRDVLEHCIQSGYNVIFEGTMRTNAVCDTVARMNSLGYRVVAGIMAVPYHVSFISVYLRYLNELRNTGHGRRVSMESHDAAYQGMPKTVKQLVEDGFCSEFVIFSRVSPDVGASLVAVTQDPLPEIEMARAITQGGDDLSSLNLLCTKIATELTFLGQNKVARSFLHRWRKMKLGIA